MVDQLVRLKNIGQTRFVEHYANERYVLEPGAQSIVPYYAMTLWTGDPTLIGDARLLEMDRLMIRYGKLTDADLWSSFQPYLEAEDLDGKKIITVLEDPEGINVTPAAPTIREAADLERVIAELKAQQAAMQEQLRQMNWKADQDEPLEDEPKAVPVGDRRGRVRDDE